MPIYEYQCKSCAHRLEKLQKVSDAPLVDCPKCLKPALKKLVSASAFRLKGSGWYETDFKTGSKKNVSNDSDPGPSPSSPSVSSSGSSAAKAAPVSSGDSASGTSSATKSE